MNFRPFDPADADGVESLGCTVVARPAEVALRVVCDQPAVGYLCAVDRGSSSNPDPGVCHVTIAVHPDFRHQGIGSALYRKAVEFARDRACDRLQTFVAEGSEPFVLEWLAELGFEETQRRSIWKADLLAFDLAIAAPFLARAERNGIEIVRATGPEDVYPVLRQVGRIREDRLPFSRWLVETWPTMKQQFLLVAKREGEVVGIHHVLTADDRADIGFTATVPEHRRQGVAGAIKAVAMLELRAMGYKFLWTGERRNEAIRSLNQKIGFVEQSRSIIFERPVPEPLHDVCLVCHATASH